MSIQAMSFYVIHERPAEFPQSFACRRYEQLSWCGSVVPREFIADAPDLEAIRQKLPVPNMDRVAFVHDNPEIVEAWM